MVVTHQALAALQREAAHQWRSLCDRAAGHDRHTRISMKKTSGRATLLKRFLFQAVNRPVCSQ